MTYTFITFHEMHSYIPVFASCQAWGDPHYITFDGYKYDFQGDCEHTLVKKCNDSDPDVPAFHLSSNNIKRKPSDSVSFLHELRLEYGGTIFHLLQDGEVRVNFETVTPPILTSGVTIRGVGSKVVSIY